MKKGNRVLFQNEDEAISLGFVRASCLRGQVSGFQTQHSAKLLPIQFGCDH
jgi:hypothetical protein